MHHIDKPFEIKDVSKSGTFAGYGSVYGNVDQGDDIVAPEIAASDQAPDDLQMDVFMISLVSGWHPTIEGAERLKSE